MGNGVSEDGEDYKVRVVRARMIEAEERVKTLKHQLEHAVAVEAELERREGRRVSLNQSSRKRLRACSRTS